MICRCDRKFAWPFAFGVCEKWRAVVAGRLPTEKGQSSLVTALPAIRRRSPLRDRLHDIS